MIVCCGIMEWQVFNFCIHFSEIALFSTSVQKSFLGITDCTTLSLVQSVMPRKLFWTLVENSAISEKCMQKLNTCHSIIPQHTIITYYYIDIRAIGNASWFHLSR